MRLRGAVAAFSVGAERGLTLVEVLAALVVLTIASLGLFAIGSMSTTGNVRNVDQVAAAALAGAKLEELRNTSFYTLASGSDGPMTAQGTPGGIFSRSWTVTSTTLPGLSTPAKTMTATVAWTGGGSITMSTIVVSPSQAFPGIDPTSGSGFPTASIRGMVQTQ